jgi:hypothetical protein
VLFLKKIKEKLAVFGPCADGAAAAARGTIGSLPTKIMKNGMIPSSSFIQSNTS